MLERKQKSRLCWNLGPEWFCYYVDVQCRYLWTQQWKLPTVPNEVHYLSNGHIYRLSVLSYTDICTKPNLTCLVYLGISIHCKKFELSAFMKITYNLFSISNMLNCFIVEKWLSKSLFTALLMILNGYIFLQN